MAIIQFPVLDFKRSLEAFHRFAGQYNKDKPLREQLRPQHSKLFARILTLGSRQLYKRNELFKDTPEFRNIDNTENLQLSTNRKALSWVENTIQINGNTVYRQILRLMDAGVIAEKVNHGSQMNFDLFITPDFLLIKDLINPDYVPVSKYLEGEKTQDKTSLNTSFTPEHLIPEKELFNNSTITVDKESLPAVRDTLVKEQERTQKKNFEKEHWGISQKKTKNAGLDENPHLLIEQRKEKEQQVAVAREPKLRDYQKGAARWFFWYVINRLFEGRSINTAHLENTLLYVEQHYFTNCLSLKAVEQLRKVYQWRIDKAKRTIERHNINMQWVFPGAYLDLNRKGKNPQTGKPYMSFANTADWPKRFEHLQRKKKYEKHKQHDFDKLNTQFRLYLNNPNLNQFRRCEAYVKKNIPHLMGHFLSQFTTTKNRTYA
jgi:hypothetical protein